MTDHERALSLLTAMEARAEAATKGPWEESPQAEFSEKGSFVRVSGTDGHPGSPPIDDGPICVLDDDEYIQNPNLQGDSTFIASVRTDAPAVYAALRAVLEIHLSRGEYCNQCGGRFPCSTVCVIAEALGGRDAE